MERGDTETDIDGLAAFLEDAKLKDKLPRAVEKCQEWGAVDIQEVLADPDLLQEFAEYLQLKLLEQRRFDDIVQRVKAGLARKDSVGSAKAGGDFRPTKLPVDGGSSYVVKNTFVESRDHQPVDLSAMARASTVPSDIHASARHPRLQARIEEGEEDEEDEEQRDSMHRSSPSEALKRLNTMELWRQYDQDGSLAWSNQHEASSSSDPFTGTAAGEQMDMAAFGASQGNPMWGMWPPMMMPPMGPIPPMYMPGMFGPGVPIYPPGMEVPCAPSEKPTPKNSLEVESVGGRKAQVTWVSPSRFLGTKDSHAHASPGFQLSLCGEGVDASSPSASMLSAVNFKIMIHPKEHSQVKGGASFKKAKGRGFVQLQCLDTLPEDAPEVIFSIAVGHGRKRGPVRHCFRSQTTGRLQSNQAEWDFNSHVDGGALTVLLEIEPCQQARGAC